MMTMNDVDSRPAAPPLSPLPTPQALGLFRLPDRELENVLLRGERPDPAQLAGWRYRGLNTPVWAGLAGIRKFMKGFYKNARGETMGYNVAVRQNGVEEPWIAKGNPFGFYSVGPVEATTRDNAYLHALLLDYAAGGNRRLDPTQTLRDYLVRAEPGSDDLLLGKAYVAVGPLRVNVHSYFVLERHERSDFAGR